jgi:hypothetical protein
MQAFAISLDVAKRLNTLRIRNCNLGTVQIIFRQAGRAVPYPRAYFCDRKFGFHGATKLRR